MNKPTHIIVHHEAPTQISNAPRFKIVNEYHKSLGFPISSLGYYCGYHRFIEKDGTVITARLDTDIGAHTIGMNDKSLGVCLAGNFDIELPTEKQKTPLTSVLRAWTSIHAIPASNIVPHRLYAQKSCPGKQLADDWARNLLKTDQIGLLQQILLLSQQLLALLTKPK